MENIDIFKATVEQLKVAAWDLYVLIRNQQNALMIIEMELTRRKEAEDAKKVEVGVGSKVQETDKATC